MKQEKNYLLLPKSEKQKKEKGDRMLDPIVHSALVIIAAWLLKYLFQFLNFPIDEATLNTLAALLVSYILSLFGYSLWVRFTFKTKLQNDRTYKPPFT